MPYGRKYYKSLTGQAVGYFDPIFLLTELYFGLREPHPHMYKHSTILLSHMVAILTALVPEALTRRERETAKGKTWSEAKRRASATENLTYMLSTSLLCLPVISDVTPGYEFEKPIRNKVQNLNQIPTQKWDSQWPRPEAFLFTSGFPCAVSLSLHVASNTRVHLDRMLL